MGDLAVSQIVGGPTYPAYQGFQVRPRPASVKEEAGRWDGLEEVQMPAGVQGLARCSLHRQSVGQANPFKERICRVFSTSPARDSLSFEDFLDLLSVFSDTATPDLKSHYAFRIFDFDDDGTLNREDLSQLVNCLTGPGEDTQLSASEMKQLIDNILEESDIDRDGTINLSEFQHVISRSPDFASSFKIVL
ncbi:calcium and integrin-binding protein 1 [Lynx pardinus]|uniref:Calcium and integrin-binding protein 1 n=1 Tax=Lynx pardinus TaxID=191816 RepID=A0A485P7M9_LYNPA|nr:calcium and integrin-binding protein 1 [Lynx pardinus]